MGLPYGNTGRDMYGGYDRKYGGEAYGNSMVPSHDNSFTNLDGRANGRPSISDNNPLVK